MSDNRICLVVLGSEGALKNALMTIILGKDLASTRSVLKKTEIYENNMFIVIPLPDDDTRGVFTLFKPDMSLLVVEDGFSEEEVLRQLDQLHKITGKPTEEFTVVLPLSHGPAGPDLFRRRTTEQQFNYCTTEQLVSYCTTEQLVSYCTTGKLVSSCTTGQLVSSCTTEQQSSYRTTGQLVSDLSRMAEKRDLIRAENSPPAALPPASTPHYPASRVNLVLLGMSGTGKSASGNTILGQKIFTSRTSSNQLTTQCQAQEVDGGRVRVVDTPDIFDDDIDSSTKAKHVRSCMALYQGEPTVFLLVMDIGRFTDGERDVLRKLQDTFGSRVHEKTIILFTRTDSLRRDGVSFEEFLNSCHPELQTIIKTCGSRCVLFDNSASGSRSGQVQKLMQKVEQLLYEQKQ